MTMVELMDEEGKEVKKCSFKQKRDELLKKLEEKEEEIDKLFQKKLDMDEERYKLEDEKSKQLEEKEEEIDKLCQKTRNMDEERYELEEEKNELEEEAHTLVDLIEGKDGEELKRERDEIGKGVFKNNKILRTDIWDWKQKVLNYQSNEDKN